MIFTFLILQNVILVFRKKYKIYFEGHMQKKKS